MTPSQGSEHVLGLHWQHKQIHCSCYCSEMPSYGVGDYIHSRSQVACSTHLAMNSLQENKNHSPDSVHHFYSFIPCFLHRIMTAVSTSPPLRLKSTPPASAAPSTQEEIILQQIVIQSTSQAACTPLYITRLRCLTTCPKIDILCNTNQCAKPYSTIVLDKPYRNHNTSTLTNQ